METTTKINEWERKEENEKEGEMKAQAEKLINDSTKSKNQIESISFADPVPKAAQQPQKSSTVEEIDNTDAVPEENKSMGVPSANFHNFDDDRVEDSFLSNQIWAMYDDDDDRMPRNYALVYNIISTKPFILDICWLNYESTSEFGTREWLGYGFPKTVGSFNIGNCVINDRLDSFSHTIKWSMHQSEEIQILPKKGDIWALYMNWSPNWNLSTPNNVIHVYEVVEVLEDYSVEKDVSVSPLVKVAKFKTIFRQIFEESVTWTIPKVEMLRFSHQIPFVHLHTLAECKFSKGFYELDPKALPVQFHNVINEDEENQAAKDILISKYQSIVEGLGD